MSEQTLRELMSVVGSGPRSADDMTQEQARAGMTELLDGDADPTTVGAFLLANRWKRNTPVELAAFVDVMRERAQPASPDADPVDCGANYDGKSNTALLGVGAGIVAAAAGTPVVVHSADRVPVDEGCTYRHVLDELGVATDLSPGESASMVDTTGFGFYDATRFNPAVHDLLGRRQAMGVRTFVNTIETLANPADATVHLGSFFHLSFARRIIDALLESETWSTERVIMFQGLEGYDDVRPGRAKVAEWDGDVEDYEVTTADYGFDVDADALAVDDVSSESARITDEVLAGERDDAFSDGIAVNAALRIYAHGDAEDLAGATERAREAIADGSAAATLAALRSYEPVREAA